MSGRRPPLPVLLCAVAALALALPHAAELRARASDALGRGMPQREAELARGFVLGEDEGIDPGTVEDFRRSGLAHLLAVSGQNVALLLLLAMPLLAALGMPLQARLAWMLGLIAAYVPIAGAGPSIQRAAVMGGLSVLATLEGRRSSRLYGLALAAIVTLGLDPAVARDVGWQLSFAAVLGILLLAAPLREALLRRGAGTRPGGGLARALAEGAAMTVAATLATAPLVAFHFGQLSTTTLLANLLAMPAVAPAMWLGMLTAGAGQLPGFPVEAFNRLAALLLAYIAAVASWCADPGWAQVGLRLGTGQLLGCYAALGAAALAAWRLPAAARGALLRTATGLSVALVAVALGLARQDGAAASPPAGLRVEVLDVGQGDAILIQAAGAPAILVDGGPPGEGLAEALSAAGVERLGAAVLTHDEADHAGGIEELLGRVPIGRLVYAAAGAELLGEARRAGARPLRVAAGDIVRAGELRLEALWPPPAVPVPAVAAPLGAAGAADPNEDALAMVLRWRHFSMLLAADAEAESAPLDPGPIDVLKVAHHGSEDAGLEALLSRSRPVLAVISVGAENSHGHPAPATLASLARHDVRVLRTDRHGTVTIEAERGRIAVGAEAGQLSPTPGEPRRPRRSPGA